MEDFPERLADYIRKELDSLEDICQDWKSEKSESQNLKNGCVDVTDSSYTFDDMRWVRYD